MTKKIFQENSCIHIVTANQHIIIFGIINIHLLKTSQEMQTLYTEILANIL